MRRTSSRVSRSAAMLALLVFGAAGQAAAGPLNPLDFTSRGAFPSAPGAYTINTTGPNPTLTEPDGTALTGIVSNGIAVFDFNSIAVGSGQTFVGTGSLPLALLSQGDATINGSINVSATSPLFYFQPTPGGPGGGGGGGAFEGRGAPPASAGGGPGGGGPGAAHLHPKCRVYPCSAAVAAGGSVALAVPELAVRIFTAAQAVPRTETSRNNSWAAAAVVAPAPEAAVVAAQSRSAPSAP